MNLKIQETCHSAHAYMYFMGVIIDRDDNDMYMYHIAVRAQVLHGKYSRNQFELCIHKLLQITDVSTDEEVALLTAVQRQSPCGGQGFVKCNCAGSSRCKLNRCKCCEAKVALRSTTVLCSTRQFAPEMIIRPTQMLL